LILPAMEISARSSAKLQCRGKKPTPSTNCQHYAQGCTSMLRPLTHPLIRFLFRIRPEPALPSTAHVVRTALPYSPPCRPSIHVPTLPHTDPVCSPVAPRVSVLLSWCGIPSTKNAISCRFYTPWPPRPGQRLGLLAHARRH
jgi:hypothetical protein